MTFLDHVRLFLHLLSVSVWVGGQLVMGGLVPTLRGISEDAPRRVAQTFGRISTGAFVVVLFTGVWSMFATPDLAHPAFEIKMLFVLVSAAGAAMHSFAKGNKAMLAAGGAMASLGAVAAMFTALYLVP